VCWQPQRDKQAQRAGARSIFEKVPVREGGGQAKIPKREESKRNTATKRYAVQKSIQPIERERESDPHSLPCSLGIMHAGARPPGVARQRAAQRDGPPALPLPPLLPPHAYTHLMQPLQRRASAAQPSRRDEAVVVLGGGGVDASNTLALAALQQRELNTDAQF
jgi:hypothetical protein